MSNNIVQELEEVFKINPTPNKETCMTLGKKFNYSDKTIYHWFWQRRNNRKITSCKGSSLRVMKVANHAKPNQPAVSSSSPEISSSRISARRVVPKRKNMQPESQEGLSTAPAKNHTNSNSSAVSRNVKLSPRKRIQEPFQEIYSQHIPNSSKSLPNGKCSQSTDHRSPELFGFLSSREISVLEKVYLHKSNPTKEEVAKLANHFVREQEKEAQIMDWFTKRRGASNDLTTHNQSLFIDYSTVNKQPEMQIIDVQQRYGLDNNVEEMHFEIGPDAVMQDEVHSVSASSPEPSNVQSAVSVPDESTDSEVVEEIPYVYVETQADERCTQNLTEPIVSSNATCSNTGNKTINIATSAADSVIPLQLDAAISCSKAGCFSNSPQVTVTSVRPTEDASFDTCIAEKDSTVIYGTSAVTLGPTVGRFTCIEPTSAMEESPVPVIRHPKEGPSNNSNNPLINIDLIGIVNVPTSVSLKNQKEILSGGAVTAFDFNNTQQAIKIENSLCIP